MVARLTLTITVVQRLKCKSKFKKELLTTGHDHGRIRNNTFDPLFLICSRLMGFASVLKVFVGVLNAKLIVDSCLNSGFAASFQVFSVVTSLGNKPAKTKHNENTYKRIVKTNTEVQSFFAGLRHSGPQNRKFDTLVCVCVLMPVLPKTFKNNRFGKLPLFVVDSEQKCATTAANKNKWTFEDPGIHICINI